MTFDWITLPWLYYQSKQTESNLQIILKTEFISVHVNLFKVPKCPTTSTLPDTSQPIIVETFGITVTQDDLNRLQDGQQLNDQLSTEIQSNKLLF